MAKTRFAWVGIGLVIAGRYRIDAALGEGGYGAVYVATQLGIERKVALKLLHQDVLVRARARERFEREALITKELTHPNVVRLFDFGTSEQGLPYIVCELLEGRSLETEIRRGPFPFARVAHVAQQMLKGLAEAHNRGIVHRDIKPANIFLCDYVGETDFVKVLDFGIAAAPLEKGTAGLTQEGVSLGTPAYMSPEQVLDQPLDGRSDLYAVGLVMAEMLSGIQVYQGTGAMQVALRQIEETPVPLDPIVTGSALGPIIRRAVAKEASQRFGSALEMLEALRQVMAGLGLSFNSAPVAFASAPAAAVASPPTRGVSGPRSPSAASLETSAPTAAAPSANSSISVPILAPTNAVATPAKGRSWPWVAGGLVAALGIAGGTYAITRATLATGKKAASSASASASARPAPTGVIVVQQAPKHDPSDPDFDDAVEAYEKKTMEQLFGAGKACGAPPPAVADFTVQTLRLGDGIKRVEAAGYKCYTHNHWSNDYGNMTFLHDKKPGFQIVYMGPTAPRIADSFQNAVHLVDQAQNRTLVIASMENTAAAQHIGDIMLGKASQ